MQAGDAAQTLEVSYAGARKLVAVCPVCGRSDLRSLHDKDRHDLGLRTCQCRYCGMVFLSPRPTNEWFDEFYQEHYWPTYIGCRFKDEDDMYIRDQVEERATQILAGIRSAIPNDPSACLDIGAGQGGMLCALSNAFPEASVQGVEPSKAGRDYCRTKHGMDVHDIDLISVEPDVLAGPFNLITCIHVLEHVRQPVPLLAKAARRLSSGGLLYVEVPDTLSDRWRGRGFFHIAHLHYFTEATLKRALWHAGLEPCHIFRGLAEIWPWAIGILARRSKTEPKPADDLPPALQEETDEIRRHVLARIAEDRPWRRARLLRLMGTARQAVRRVLGI